MTALLQLYRRLRPAMVHHVTVKPVLYGGIAARLARVPAVVSAISGLGYLFTDGFGIRRRLLRQVAVALYRVALRHPNCKVILQNPDDAAALRSTQALGCQQEVMIRGSGVDLGRFSPCPEPNGGALIVLPARLLRDKGVQEFVEAARLLKRRRVEGRFALVGCLDLGNPSGLAEEDIRGWCEQGIVEWWGHQADMSSVLAASHLVVLPSYGEGLPKALVEACASGRAVVTTDVPGCREVVCEGANGLLVPPRDSVALANAIELLLGDAGERVRMGRRGRERAEAEFSIEEVVRRHLETYEDLLMSSGPFCTGSAKAE